MDLTGKVCVITGASSGIGQSLAIKISLKGATVVMAARRNSKLITIKEKIDTEGGNVLVSRLTLQKNSNANT